MTDLNLYNKMADLGYPFSKTNKGEVEEMLEWLISKNYLPDMFVTIGKMYCINLRDSELNFIKAHKADTLSNTVAKACVWVLEQDTGGGGDGKRTVPISRR